MMNFSLIRNILKNRCFLKCTILNKRKSLNIQISGKMQIQNVPLCERPELKEGNLRGAIEQYLIMLQACSGFFNFW